MLNKVIRLFAVLVLLAATFLVFPACGGGKVTVSFVQEGRDTIVVEVAKGGSLNKSDMPFVRETTRTGYRAVWDTDGIDFKNITENIVVYAIEVPKTSRIGFVMGTPFTQDDGIPLVDADGNEIAVLTFTYDAPYTLPVPVLDGYSFTGWYMNIGSERFADSGVWKTDQNFYLEAHWEQV